MNTVCSVNGVPSCANPWLLQTLLRDEWGFRGYVVSDEGAIEWILLFHRFTNSIRATAAAGVSAGACVLCMYACFRMCVWSLCSAQFPLQGMKCVKVQIYAVCVKYILFHQFIFPLQQETSYSLHRHKPGGQPAAEHLVLQQDLARREDGAAGGGRGQGDGQTALLHPHEVGRDERVGRTG